jgi:hypothetical protein
MIRNLLIVSGAGLVLAIVGIGGSMAVGGADLARHTYTWALDDDDNGIRFQRTTNGELKQTMINRQVAWDNREALAIRVPGDVLYVQTSENPGISITGPQQLVDRVTYDSGRILISDYDRDRKAYVSWGPSGIRGWNTSEGLKIVVRAPSVKSFNLQGETDLEVQGYEHPTLDLVLTGNSDVEVYGRAEKVSVDASGNASAYLQEVISTDANINVSGNADVKTAANGKVVINGSGTSVVRMTRRAAEVQQTLSGEAEVDQD